MNWLEGFLYGLLSGFTEFLPVSSQAHQTLFVQMLGLDAKTPISNLIVHLAVLAALFTGCRGLLSRIRREQKLMPHTGRKRGQQYVPRSTYDLRFVRAAALPMAVCMLLYVVTRSLCTSSLYIALFSIVNGVIIYISERFPHANKDAHAMSGMDAILFGISGALSVFPGISRVGAALSTAAARGADAQHALNWAFLLSIPALVVLILFDVLGIATAELGSITFPVIVGYITAAIGAFCGGYFSIAFVRSIVVRSGMAGFAYYSWGTALFAFILYLIT